MCNDRSGIVRLLALAAVFFGVMLAAAVQGAPSPSGLSGSTPASPALTLPATAAGRDPFKLPPPPAPRSKLDASSRLPGNRPPGIRGLVVSSLKLEGLVSQNSGREMIAVVTNDTGRAYFLRTNQQLYDGAVMRITRQAVYFTEKRPDAQGRMAVRTVVKWLNPPAGDRQ